MRVLYFNYKLTNTEYYLEIYVSARDPSRR